MVQYGTYDYGRKQSVDRYVHTYIHTYIYIYMLKYVCIYIYMYNLQTTQTHASTNTHTHITHTHTWKCCLRSRMDVHKGHNTVAAPAHCNVMSCGSCTWSQCARNKLRQPCRYAKLTNGFGLIWTPQGLVRTYLGTTGGCHARTQD